MAEPIEMPFGIWTQFLFCTLGVLDPVADLGGGAAAPPLATFRKIQGLPISKIVRTADSTIIIITNFYLASSSHEILLRVGGREGMKGLGALQRHQLPHPLAKILHQPLPRSNG